MPYIHFTDQQKEQAAGVDLAAFLESRGEKLVRSGRDLRLTSDHSVTIQGNRWYDHATQTRGGPISFVRQFPKGISVFVSISPVFPLALS